MAAASSNEIDEGKKRRRVPSFLLYTGYRSQKVLEPQAEC
jgi:hypothetical protein